MTSKVFDVSILLDLHKVNCPGVWLCPKGKVSIKVCLFGVSDFTKQVAPNFPLIFNERFHFQRKFRNANTLPELYKELGASLLTMQLYQFPTETVQSVKLAVFNSPLAHVLSPTNVIHMTRDKQSEVDLLFYPCKVFPGIIAPKAEVVAKLAVAEIFEPPKMKMNMTVSSLPTEKRFADDKKILRQQPVCHTKNYFGCKCFKEWYSSECQDMAHRSKGYDQHLRPRSARRPGRPLRKKKRRFKSCSTAYCDGSSSSSSSESEEDADRRGNKCISNVIGADCRCLCAREARNNARRPPSPPHSSEYSSSDYTDVNQPVEKKDVNEPLKATAGCQCFRKTWRDHFEQEMHRKKNGTTKGVKTTADDVYRHEQHEPDNVTTHEVKFEQQGNQSSPVETPLHDETRPPDSFVLEKSTEGRKWGVKAFNFPQSTSVR